MRRHRIDDEKLKDLVSQGKTRREIAMIMKAKYCTVYDACKRLGVDPPRERSNFTPEIIDRVRDLASNGRTRTQICQLLGLTYSRLNNLVSANNIKTPRLRDSAGYFNREVARGLIAAGAVVNEICNATGVNRATIIKWAKSEGLFDLMVKGKRSRLDYQELIDLINQGHSVTKIAKTLKVDVISVRREIERFGLEIKPRVTLDPSAVRILADAGYTQVEIARVLGTNQSKVSDCMIKHAIMPNCGRGRSRGSR